MRLAKALRVRRHDTLPSLQSLDTLERKSAQILNRWPDVTTQPPVGDRERLVQTLAQKLKAGDWSDTPMSFMIKAAWALFDTERRIRSDLKHVRQFYYDEIKATTKGSFLAGLFKIYLGTYEPGAGHTLALSYGLAARADRLGGRALKLIAGIPEVLDGENAALLVGKRMAEMPDPWTGLKAVGMDAPHAPGLMDHAHLAYVRILDASGITSKRDAEMLIGWLKPEGREARQGGAAEALSALIRPWLRRQPPVEHLRYLTDRLVGLYRDPRVDRGGAWAGVDRPTMDTFLRWLTGENIRFFLDVVSEVEDSHMWEPRRKFWLGLHERGRVDAAWVAFDPAGARLAHKRGTGRSGGATLRYGRQTAGGSRSTTSLLILKSGSKIIVEGSHSYKIHIFNEDARGTPKLYQPDYDCESIRLIRGAQSHAHLGHWERWVLENI
ncbi:MAG: hypothetical protein KIT43_08260 [Bauldia sp.]|nr:hypothetical protein [Bauldia sp.]MCW5716883.1 hypothetical protein [Bauldia sp.]